MSLPVELNTKQQIELVRDYARENFVDKGVCADFSIHDKGDGNPHAHIMLTMRDVDENGFGKRRAEEQGNGYFGREQRIRAWRGNWANTANKHLERHGFDERIDHRTLEAQGIDREPTIHIGVKAYNMEKQGIPTEKGRINREIKHRNYIRELMMKKQREIELLRQSKPFLEQTKTDSDKAWRTYVSPDRIERERFRERTWERER